MGRRQGSHHARSRIGIALLVFALAGCNGNYAYQVSSPAAPVAPASAGVSVSTSSGSGVFGALLILGSLGMASGFLPIHDPVMDPDRRVLEQDCTKPIQDYSANLRCR